MHISSEMLARIDSRILARSHYARFLCFLVLAILAFVVEAEENVLKLDSIGGIEGEPTMAATSSKVGKSGTKKGRVKKVLMVFWAVFFVAMLGGMVFAIWKVLACMICMHDACMHVCLCTCPLCMCLYMCI